MDPRSERSSAVRHPFAVAQLPQRLADLAAIVVVVLGALIPPAWGGSALNDVGQIAVLALIVVAVVARSWLPRIAASAVLAAALLGIGVGGGLISALLATLITLFSVGRRTDRRTTILFAVSAVVVFGLANLAQTNSPWSDGGGLIQLCAFVGFAAAAGDAGRSRSEYILAITERAHRAEESKESEARRRVAEERVTIARDLHDVLAHQITVISLHANVAAQALPERPTDAQRSHAIIHIAAREVLRELSVLLAVLRSGEVDTAPTPGMADVPALVQTFRDRGLDITVRLEGDQRPLEGMPDVVGYRVLQEALANAQKHGDDSSALLHIEHLSDEVVLTVTNTSTGVAADSGGHGLLGVRERVSSVGGRFESARGPGPVYRFTARVPR